MSSSTSYNSPCAACKFLRRKCMTGCIFAPHFPPEETQKFANVHKIFGASNVTKILNELPPHQREDAVNSLAYEAEARVRDPVYGCVGAISYLQRQVDRLQKELDAANANLIRLAAYNGIPPLPPTTPPTVAVPPPRQRPVGFERRIGSVSGGGGGFYDQTPSSFMTFPYSNYNLPWNNNEDNYNNLSHDNGGGTFDDGNI